MIPLSKILVLVLYASAMQRSFAEMEPGRNIHITPVITVRIFNELVEDKADVTIHCKSKDDDLGVHVVPFGKTYEFSFRENIWGSTLFFCGFNSKGRSVVFDVFESKRDYERILKYSIWRVRKDGVHGFQEKPTKEDLIFKWK
ncbi:hypothetical protein K2173_003700 [Erythroxylum novogranatense]|uniref:S-protein homolog n=1 Tax=Erythroxylum novogranatense TaxID=1862640 RepID=A0AAV8TB20_9ROSI|nr:hypothetical protein K2173_003700 [Erythroxylum novogranatense]